MALKDSDLNKWCYKEHMETKHELLIKYLGTWLTVLGSSGFNKLCYFDCFAGRGEYKDGEKGSPIKSLDTIRHRYKTVSKLSNTKLYCVFIEADPDNYENLKKTLEKYETDNKAELSKVKIEVVNGKFADEANKLLDAVKDNLIPSFFFIDPFGWDGIDFKVIKRLLAIKRCEVFINFMTEQVNRFFEDDKLKGSINSLFGCDDCVEQINLLVKNERLTREAALLKFYRNQLMNLAGVKYTFAFRVFDDDRCKCKYNLIHATNNIRGAEIMKEIMANEGTKDRFAYLGPAQGQSTLDDFTRIDTLKTFLVKKYSGKQIRMATIIDENFNESPYVTKHYHQALKQLLEQKKVNIAPLGKRGGFTPDAIIDFLA